MIKKEQVASVLSPLAANTKIPTLLFLLNNPTGIQRLQTLDPRCVVLGFPGIGGAKQGDVVRYVLIRQQQTTLGEVEGCV
jgi:2-dehydropantoate 2-reductase